jgi:hypothetical protein
MKELYVLALALQILLAKQMRVENSSTGRLPKEVWIGTLLISGIRYGIEQVFVFRVYIP